MSARYMIITYIQDSAGKWNEITSFKNSIKMKHYQTAKLILDFKEKKCVVNAFNREAEFLDMLTMYKKLLGDKLTPHLPEEFR